MSITKSLSTFTPRRGKTYSEITTYMSSVGRNTQSFPKYEAQRFLALGDDE